VDLIEDIRATFDEFAEAWNRHDAEAMANCWIEDGSVVDLWGGFAARRAGIRDFLAGEHEQPMRDSAYRITKLDVKPISSATAIAECDAVIDEVRAPNGKAYTLHHKLDAVLVRDGERWRFLSVHPSFSHA
jgi:uncharacterized protein (TIGR02246 family)